MFTRRTTVGGLGIAGCLFFCLVCDQQPLGTILDEASAPAPVQSAAAPISAAAVLAGNASAALEQVRNGSGGAATTPTANWQNGNVNASQAHMLEGYSEPFRTIITNAPTGVQIRLVIGYDVKHSNKNAYDYLTQYDRLELHGPPVPFPHAAEAINPLAGVAGVNAATGTFPIPSPAANRTVNCVAGDFSQPSNSFSKLAAIKKVMTLFGGTINNVEYDRTLGFTGPNLLANTAEERVAVTFTLASPTAVLAWGGHIARQDEWGCPGNSQSAGGISGSPYHMRLVRWNGHPSLGNLGNQDRSLSAGAVVVSGACCDEGACTVTTRDNCTNNGGVYQGDNSECTASSCTGSCCLPCPEDPESFNYTCLSDVTEAECTTEGGQFNGNGSACDGATCGPTCPEGCLITCPDPITVECGGSTDPSDTGSATCIPQAPGADCSSSYEDSFAAGCGDTGVITRTWTCSDANSKVSVTCEQIITIEDTTAPTIEDCPTESIPLGCNPTLPTCDDAKALVSASDTCGEAELDCAAGEIEEDGCNRSQTFTITATDDCENPSDPCEVTYTWTAAPSAPVFDNCTDSNENLGCLADPSTIPHCSTDVTATDACGAAEVTCCENPSENRGEDASCGNPDSVTNCVHMRTLVYTATGTCGETTTCTQTYAWNED